MPTFFFLGKEFAVFPDVYEPSEDSFLLAESISVKKGALVLDLGTGTGIQGINAAMQGAKKAVCTDLSGEALKNAAHNAEKLGAESRFEFRKGSLFSCIKKNEKFDLIIFNPPYVASGKKAKFADLDGGKKGRETLDKFLLGFPKHLEKNGACFFLQSSLNGESRTRKILEKQGFGCDAIARKRIFFEELIVFKAMQAGNKNAF